MEAVSGAYCMVETIGMEGSGADWIADPEPGHTDPPTQGSSTFELIHKGRSLGRISLPLIGKHNVMNALAAAATAYRMGVRPAHIVKSLSAFRGIRRRLTLIAKKDDILLYDDFAHHPTAIRATIEGLREAYPGRRLWAIFEPRSWATRKNIFEERITRALGLADMVIIGDIYRKGSAPGEELDPEKVADGIRESGGWAEAIGDPVRIANRVKELVKRGDILVIMTNGSFGGLSETLAKVISDI
jgi:UDP-N-acetylmuramate: L-alanyl-gamma-D-glutamyl-meso-diaminopimelate ligase